MVGDAVVGESVGAFVGKGVTHILHDTGHNDCICAFSHSPSSLVATAQKRFTSKFILRSSNSHGLSTFLVGDADGCMLGPTVGLADGTRVVGETDGARLVGAFVGAEEGVREGIGDGALDGCEVGDDEG